MKQRAFITQETKGCPFDVTLVVADGKEFKAHRRVLSEASPFFEKLFNNGMRESNEGVVHLEMFTEVGMTDILEFIYTGSLQISSEDQSQELIAMADYLVLLYLKTAAGKVLAEKLNPSNSIWTYYFAVRHHCKELTSRSKKFILANFSTVARTSDFLNLTSTEVKMWISSDQIEVNAEEDVFKIILTWINCDKIKRKKYFADLFREVRLPYVSPDYLHSEIMTHDLVNDNEGCMDIVRAAMKNTDSKDHQHLIIRPRKSLEIPVILVHLSDWEEEEKILCYYPRDDKWSMFHGTVPPNTEKVFSCSGKLYCLSQRDRRLSRYNSFSNCWTSLPYDEQRILHQIFVGNEDTIFALVSEDKRSCPECVSLRSHGVNSACQKRHLSFITKYRPDSNSWEDISSFDLRSRKGICIVANDNFIYFLGGEDEALTQQLYWSTGTLTKADRCDLSTNTWNKIADIQVARRDAYGTAMHEKIFIAGGFDACDWTMNAGEVYNETENEWQLIASFNLKIERTTCNPGAIADGTLYILGGLTSSKIREYGVVECYDPDKNEWRKKTQIPLQWLFLGQSYCPYFLPKYDLIRGSMRVFKGSHFLEKASFLKDSSKLGQRKCLIV